ncbi:penicillin-binding protein activator [Elongatibacter sediminis]|uniref:Penicillin-binding protein activator n=1 Tax=Elongatibacter sediminis TaxID=3119006 RepID=A0AAW9RFJ3_9GAMM
MSSNSNNPSYTFRPLLDRFVFPLLVLVVLASCAGAPPPALDVPAAEDPEAAFAQGRYEEAARAWQREAVTAPAVDADVLRINAANAWILAGQPAAAADALRWVSHEALPEADRARLNLLLADLALRDERAEDAEMLLQDIGPELPFTWQERYQQLLANTRRALARPGSRNLSEARAISQSLSTYQPDRALSLLEALERIPSGELAWRAENPRADREFTGWLDLARVIRAHLVEPEGLESAVDAWKGRHTFHPLTRTEALDLWLRYRQRFTPPPNVAVLLPQSGRYEAAGRAIRDGIVAAYTDRPDGSELHFFAAGDDPLDTPSAYFEAREEGARWIVGPLQPESVQALLNLAGLATPVLALNRLPAGFLPAPGLQGQVYGIALSQEDEVRAIAREMRARGLLRALVLAPESEWGERMAAVFNDEFLRENTEIVASTRYLESENDHSAVLERLLQIDASKARAQRLENTLQMDLNFEPVRRDDIDVIFLAASASQGLLLRPQLRFHSAGRLPVYATSRIYSGVPDRARDQDLDGVRIPITPLQLRADETDTYAALPSVRNGSFAPLYALGRDAWSILPWLELMKRDPDFRFHGASGTYRASPDGNLAREPTFAEFRGGRPVPVPAPDRQAGLRTTMAGAGR